MLLTKPGKSRARSISLVGYGDGRRGNHPWPAKEKGFGSPIPTNERRSPIKQTVARKIVAVSVPGLVPPEIDTALWFVAHEDYKLCAAACFRAKRFIRDNQRRSRRHHCCDLIQCVLGDHELVERCFGVWRISQHLLGVPVNAISAPVLARPLCDLLDVRAPARPRSISCRHSQRRVPAQ